MKTCACGCGNIVEKTQIGRPKQYYDDHAKFPEQDPEIRLKSLLDSTQCPPKGCWIWLGNFRSSKTSTGQIDRRPIYKNQYVYRLFYELLIGSVPVGKVLHHKCRNSECPNPFHCKPISQGQHLAHHGISGDNHQRFKTQCPRGHLYTEANTYWYHRKNGGWERFCRSCQIINKANYRKRKAKEGW